MTKAFVAMSKKTGDLCVLIPLYTEEFEDAMGPMNEAYQIIMKIHPTKPVAYLLDIGEERSHIFGVGVKKYLEVLGDL